jgi:hypothetical protein
VIEARLTPCQPWTGKVRPNGYGRTGTGEYAHRAAVGAKAGEVVRHLCDNQLCVNPQHLRKGTQKQNLMDMRFKSRAVVNGRKLTEADVREARELYAKGGTPYIELAARYGVARSVIQDAVKHKTWKHVE